MTTPWSSVTLASFTLEAKEELPDPIGAKKTGFVVAPQLLAFAEFEGTLQLLEISRQEEGKSEADLSGSEPVLPSTYTARVPKRRNICRPKTMMSENSEAPYQSGPLEVLPSHWLSVSVC